MWEKSRFQNANGGWLNPGGPDVIDEGTPSTVPSWANATTNVLGFQDEPMMMFSNWTTYMGWGISALITGDACGQSTTITVNPPSVNMTMGVPPTAGALNQWFQLETELCFQEDLDAPTERVLYHWSNQIYCKVTNLVKAYNTYNCLASSFYFNGEFYDTLQQIKELYLLEYPESATTTSGMLSPIYNANGNAIQTVNDLENYIDSQDASTPIEVTYLNDTIMPDLSGLQSALANELIEKGASVNTANATVTNLMGNYFDAVDFALDTLQDYKRCHRACFRHGSRWRHSFF